MTSSNIQILECLKQGLSVDETAQALGYDVEAVKAVVMFDTEVNKEIEKHQSKLEGEFASMEAIALSTLKRLMVGADKDSVCMAAAAYVLDERLGLKKPRINTNITLNIGDFNSRLEAVRLRKQQMETKCIEVESSVVENAVV